MTLHILFFLSSDGEKNRNFVPDLCSQTGHGDCLSQKPIVQLLPQKAPTLHRCAIDPTCSCKSMIDASTRHISIFYCRNQIIVKFILALSSIVQHSGNPPTLRQSNGCKCTCSEFCSVYAMFSNGLFLSVFPNMCTIHNFTAFLCQFYVDNITLCIVCKLYAAITHREFILQILSHTICPISRTYCHL